MQKIDAYKKNNEYYFGLKKTNQYKKNYGFFINHLFKAGEKSIDNIKFNMEISEFQILIGEILVEFKPLNPQKNAEKLIYYLKWSKIKNKNKL